jgi:hypothetical protein
MMKYIFISLLICPGLSYGCSMMCDTIEEMYSKADYVFLGYTTKVKERGFNWFKGEGHEPNVDVYFDIKRNWKGDWGNKPLKTVQNKWSCYGGGFQEQRSYIMFLNNDARLTLCGQKQYSEELVKKLDSISSEK